MNNLVSYDPFVDTGMDELFRGFFKPVRMEGARTPVPIKMDVAETKDGPATLLPQFTEARPEFAARTEGVFVHQHHSRPKTPYRYQ